MSLLNKLFSTIKSTTGVDVGSIANNAEKTIAFAAISKKAKGLALLNWKWSEDGRMP